MTSKFNFKEILTKIVLNLLKVIYIIPIDKKSIFFMSYGGEQISCNPKYIYEFINANNKQNLKLIWVVSNKEDLEKLNKEGHKVVKRNSLKYYIKLLTSKVIITNVSISSYNLIRKKQYLINTWHGGGAYKRALFNETEVSKLVKDIYANKVDLYISSCKLFSKFVVRETFGYKGDILECGLPRNDIFFKNDLEIKNKVKEIYNVQNKKILLYAPTYRDVNKDVNYSFDYEEILSACETKFGGEWVVFLRAHHLSDSINIDESDRIINVSNYPDMQELLYTSDMLITDYSSSIWDFSLMRKPCFLYATDLDLYLKERNFYIDIKKWHFPLSENSEDLINNIMNYDEYEYLQNINLHHSEWGSFETGQATEKIVERILTELSQS